MRTINEIQGDLTLNLIEIDLLWKKRNKLYDEYHYTFTTLFEEKNHLQKGSIIETTDGKKYVYEGIGFIYSHYPLVVHPLKKTGEVAKTTRYINREFFRLNYEDFKVR